MYSASTVAVVVPSPATSEVLRRGFLDELRAHVLERVLELDVLGDGDAVLGHGRAAPALVEDRVAAAGPEGAADGPRELAGPGEELLPRIVGVRELLGCHGWSFRFALTVLSCLYVIGGSKDRP